MSINEEKLKSSMESVKDGLAETGERLASAAQTIVEALGKMTPEQRMVVEFLAENPEIAEAFQELNQKLARQRAIGVATKETAQPKEPLIKHEGMRKTFRDWCVINGLDEGEFRYYNNGTLRSTADDNYSIWFLQLALHTRLQEGIDYTFADLCGEEEDD